MISYKLYKILFVSFKQFIYQIAKDAMLFLACVAPILCGLFIRLGIPSVENLLLEKFNYVNILSPYYLMFDLFLAIMTAMMFCFVSSMVILGEIDDGITSYMAVTPLGKSGYLISSIGLPMIFSFFMTIIVLLIFSLTNPSFIIIIGISILSSILGFIMSMLVISISTNKVEGMAVTKLSGIFMIGIPAPFFASKSLQCIFFLLPSFWISKFSLENKIIYFVLCIAVSSVWILFLLKKFMKKIK